MFYGLEGELWSHLTSQVEEIVVLETIDGLKLTTDVELLGGREEVLDTRVGVIVAAKDLLGLLDPVERSSASRCQATEATGGYSLVGSVDILNIKNGNVSVVTEIAEGKTSARLDAQLVDGLLVHIEVDGHTKEVAIGKAVGLNNTKAVN